MISLPASMAARVLLVASAVTVPAAAVTVAVVTHPQHPGRHTAAGPIRQPESPPAPTSSPTTKSPSTLAVPAVAVSTGHRLVLPSLRPAGGPGHLPGLGAPAGPTPRVEPISTVPATPAPSSSTPTPSSPPPSVTPPAPLVEPPPVTQTPVPTPPCGTDTSIFSDAGVSDQVHHALTILVPQHLLTATGDHCLQVTRTLNRDYLAAEIALALDVPAPLPASELGTFTDIDATHDPWAYRYVEALKRAGLMSGVSSNTFDPHLASSPEQTAAIFTHIVDVAQAGPLPVPLPAPVCDPTSPTTLVDTTASDAVHAQLEGLLPMRTLARTNDPRCFEVTGMRLGSSSVSRQDFAIVLARVFDVPLRAPATATFSDVPTTSYAFTAVESVHAAGLMRGMGGGLFGYNQVISAQDMTIIFKRGVP